MTIPDLSVGDSEKPSIDIAPYQVGSTAATLTSHSPADTDETGTAVPLGVGVETVADGVPVLRFTATAAVQYPVAGWWVRGWKVTGVGACEPDERFFVAPNPTAGGPTWTPTLAGVADYVPHRTVPAGFESQGSPVNTFTDSTTPPASSVQRIIRRAVSWVLSATGALVTTGELDEAAQECAALRAAGFVELAATPNADRELAADLFKQAEAALKTLVARNEALTGEDPDDPDAVFEIVPAWSCTDYSF